VSSSRLFFLCSDSKYSDASFKIQEIKKFYQKSKPLGFMYKGVATVSN
jgi:hypothetical protein